MKPSFSTVSIATTIPVFTALRVPLRWRRPAGLIAVGLVAWTVVLIIDAFAGLHPHLPQSHLLHKIPAVLWLHVGAALSALVIGFALLVGVKGRSFHKVAGWTWAACMMTVAISSFWLLDNGHFSYIHFLSGWVSIAVPMALAAVRRQDLATHRAMMTRIFMGGLIIAGAFTFVPGRLMWRLFLS
jgi:uncharacterized membrane protein